MLNFLLETKKEYILQLTNLIYFKVFEGLDNIYKKSINKSNEDDILKVFQKQLKRINRWDTSFLINETNRIFCDNIDLANNLLKAIIKSQIIMMTFDPNEKTKKINPEVYDCIKIHNLVHNIYIECARILWDCPYLFYHKYPPLEIKRNQREIFDIIKKSVEEAIRKLLPLQHILDIYLGEQYTPSEIGEKISDKEKSTMIKLAELIGNLNTNLMVGGNNLQQVEPLNQAQIQPLQNNIEQNQPVNQIQPVQNNINNNIDNQVKDTIQEILDKNDVKLSESSSDNFIKNVQKKEDQEKLEMNNTQDQESLDSKIKNILSKDLGDSEVEASVSYKPEDTENYQEIFGNSENKKETEKTVNSLNTVEKQKLMKKNKFFNNYLNL